MFRNCQDIRQHCEISLDRELLEEEQHELESHLATCAACRLFFEQANEEQSILREHLQTHVETALSQVNFDLMYTQLTARLQEENTLTSAKSPAASTASASWFERLRSLFQAHPSIPFAMASAFVVAIVFSIPFFDPGPDANDCVVDKMISSNTSEIAILQTQNQLTGQRMTVIVVNEPPAEQEDQTDDNDAKKSPHKSKTPAKSEP